MSLILYPRATLKASLYHHKLKFTGYFNGRLVAASTIAGRANNQCQHPAYDDVNRALRYT